jgi:hypothetical protein
MPDLFYDTEDPRGYKVFLYDKLYNNHIRDRHVEASVECVLGVIENPDFIVQDIDYSDRQNYYTFGVVDADPNCYLKVCVQINGDIRKIVTAFRTDGPKLKEQVIWQQ